MGCGGSKDGAPGSNVPRKQGQGEADKDAAAAEIQGAAAAYMKKKGGADLSAKQDAAAADIQGAAAGYLAKKRADEAANAPGIIDGIVGFFSNRPPAPAPAADLPA